MEVSTEKFPKLIIYCDYIPVGVISVENKGKGESYLVCICVITQYQCKGKCSTFYNETIKPNFYTKYIEQN